MSLHSEESEQVMAYEEQYQTYFQRIRLCVASTGVLFWPLPESKLKKGLVIVYSAISLVVLIVLPVYEFSNLSRDTNVPLQLYSVRQVGKGFTSLCYVMLWFAVVYLLTCINDTFPMFSAFDRFESTLEFKKFHLRFRVFQVLSSLVSLFLTVACIPAYHLESGLKPNLAFIVYDTVHTFLSKYQKFMSCAIIISLNVILHHELHIVAGLLEGIADNLELLLQKVRDRFLKLSIISNRLDHAVSCIIAIEISFFIFTLCTSLLLSANGVYSSSRTLFSILIMTGTMPVIFSCIWTMNKVSV